MDSNTYIYIGKIIGTFGIKGELKVYSESDFIESRFKRGATIVLDNNKTKMECKVSSFRIHNKTILITINDLKDINMVEKYVGYEIYATSNEDLELEEDEYYLDDLVDLDVFDENNNYIGKVFDFIEVPQGYIMEIKNSNDKKLIPFVDEYILEITEDKIIVKVLEICQ